MRQELSRADIERERERWQLIASHYHVIRETLIGSSVRVVVNARTQEDDLHTALIQVCVSDCELTTGNLLSVVRARYNALRKGNRIEDNKLIEYTTEETSYGMDI